MVTCPTTRFLLGSFSSRKKFRTFRRVRNISPTLLIRRIRLRAILRVYFSQRKLSANHPSMWSMCIVIPIRIPQIRSRLTDIHRRSIEYQQSLTTAFVETITARQERIASEGGKGSFVQFLLFSHRQTLSASFVISPLGLGSILSHLYSFSIFLQTKRRPMFWAP